MTKAEKILAPDPTVQYPRCSGGRRACPPEDCGGADGYANFLAARETFRIILHGQFSILH